jgi:hypothetical protein
MAQGTTKLITSNLGAGDIVRVMSLAFYRCAWPTDSQRTDKALEIETVIKTIILLC